MPSDKAKNATEENRGCVASYLDTARREWNNFITFLWNPAEKTVLGRGAKNWGQIFIFYAIYYSFLAALFAIAISIVLSTLDPYVPRFQTRLQGPGLSIQPRLPSRQALSSDIIFTVNDSMTYRPFIHELYDFLGKYGTQSNSTQFRDCPESKVNREAPTTSTVPACAFYPSDLAACGPQSSTFGYDAGEPCILVKVNRIINWFPVGYTNLSVGGNNKVSKAPDLLEVLNGKAYNPLLMYVACYGLKAPDQLNLNGEIGVSENTKYFPSHGIPFKYYPYYGNKRSPHYRTPVVAVKFTNVTRNVDIKVGCKAYAANIVDDSRMQIGFYNFMLRIDQLPPPPPSMTTTPEP